MSDLFFPGQRPESVDPQAVPPLQAARYTLNAVGWNVVAALFARLAYRLYRRECVERFYTTPQAGFVGWIEHPRLGVLAFRRQDTGALQFKW